MRDRFKPNKRDFILGKSNPQPNQTCAADDLAFDFHPFCCFPSHAITKAITLTLNHWFVFVLTIKECRVLSFGESYDRCSRCWARSENLGNPTFDENDPEIFGKDTEKNLHLCLENLCARNNRKSIYSVYGETIEMKCLCDKIKEQLLTKITGNGLMPRQNTKDR